MIVQFAFYLVDWCSLKDKSSIPEATVTSQIVEISFYTWEQKPSIDLIYKMWESSNGWILKILEVLERLFKFNLVVLIFQTKLTLNLK
jgi:hypothetical protein